MHTNDNNVWVALLCQPKWRLCEPQTEPTNQIVKAELQHKKICFLELGFVLRFYFVWLLLVFKFVLHFLYNVLARSVFDFQDVGDDCLSETKAGPNSLRVSDVTLTSYSFWGDVLLTAYSAVPLAVFQTLTTNDSGESCFYNCVCIKITACVPLQHSIIVSNSLQAEVGSHNFWGNLIHKHINLGLNINIWIRLFPLFSLNFCAASIIFHLRCQPQITSCSKCFESEPTSVALLGVQSQTMARLSPWIRVEETPLSF